MWPLSGMGLWSFPTGLPGPMGFWASSFLCLECRVPLERRQSKQQPSPLRSGNSAALSNRSIVSQGPFKIILSWDVYIQTWERMGVLCLWQKVLINKKAPFLVHFQGCSEGCCHWSWAWVQSDLLDGLFLGFCWALSIRLAAGKDCVLSWSSRSFSAALLICLVTGAWLPPLDGRYTSEKSLFFVIKAYNMFQWILQNHL